MLWKDVEADGSVDTKTPSKVAKKDEMGRLEKVRVYLMTRNVGLTKSFAACEEIRAGRPSQGGMAGQACVSPDGRNPRCMLVVFSSVMFSSHTDHLSRQNQRSLKTFSYILTCLASISQLFSTNR